MLFKKLLLPKSRAYLYINLLRILEAVLGYFLWVIFDIQGYLYPIVFISFGFALDCWDWVVVRKTNLTLEEYEIVDKIVDSITYIFVMFFAFSFFPQYSTLLFIALVYRLFGVCLMLVVSSRKTLVFFPNFFADFFLFFGVATVFSPLNFLLDASYIYLCLFFLSLFAIFREYSLHVRRIILFTNLNNKLWGVSQMRK